MAEPTTDAEPASLHQQRAYWGLVVMGVRSVFQHVVVFLATIYLARVLSRADYGVFGILQLGLRLFNLLGVAGLAAALVQQKEIPDRRILSSIWWIQMVLSIIMIGIAFLSADILLVIRPELPESTPWLLRGMSISLFFTMLRSIPYLLLERELKFGQVSVIDFIGTVTYYGTAILLANYGAGAGALVAAFVGESILRAVGAYITQPFIPSLTFDIRRTWDVLRFGLNFQGIHIMTFFDSAISPVIAGLRINEQTLGDVRFAEGQGWFPTVFLGIVRRVSFPYFSRLQDQQEALP